MKKLFFILAITVLFSTSAYADCWKEGMTTFCNSFTEATDKSIETGNRVFLPNKSSALIYSGFPIEGVPEETVKILMEGLFISTGRIILEKGKKIKLSADYSGSFDNFDRCLGWVHLSFYDEGAELGHRFGNYFCLHEGRVIMIHQ